MGVRLIRGLIETSTDTVKKTAGQVRSVAEHAAKQAQVLKTSEAAVVAVGRTVSSREANRGGRIRDPEEAERFARKLGDDIRDREDGETAHDLSQVDTTLHVQ